MTRTDYQTALQKLMEAPLTLTEDDFAVLDAFNPADERRARQAVRTKQLAIVAAKAGPPDVISRADAAADAIEYAIKTAITGAKAKYEAMLAETLAPLLRRIEALEAQEADRRKQVDELQSAVEYFEACGGRLPVRRAQLRH
jgi:hypothetical protein